MESMPRKRLLMSIQAAEALIKVSHQQVGVSQITSVSMVINDNEGLRDH